MIHVGTASTVVWMGGCYSALPLPVASPQASTANAFEEHRAINRLLESEEYKQALVRATGAVEQLPRDIGLQEAMVRAQQGADLLDVGPAAKDSVMRRMTVTEDAVEQIRFYSHEFQRPWIHAGMRVYIVQSMDNPRHVWMRYEPHRAGGRWLFADGFTVVAGRYRFDKANLRFKRNHSTGVRVMSVRPRITTREWINLKVADEELEMIRAVIGSDEAVLRFRGQIHSHDYAFSEMDKLIYQDLLTAFDVLTNDAR
ncbi:MAG: hypothetical protein AAGB48_09715 [Planctomycetota bacterium]